MFGYYRVLLLMRTYDQLIKFFNITSKDL